MPAGERAASWKERLVDEPLPLARRGPPGPRAERRPGEREGRGGGGRRDTRQGPEFFAARARAVVRLHRAPSRWRAAPESRQEKAEAIGKALRGPGGASRARAQLVTSAAEFPRVRVLLQAQSELPESRSSQVLMQQRLSNP